MHRLSYFKHSLDFATGNRMFCWPNVYLLYFVAFIDTDETWPCLVSLMDAILFVPLRNTQLVHCQTKYLQSREINIIGAINFATLPPRASEVNYSAGKNIMKKHNSNHAMVLFILVHASYWG